MPDYAKTQIYKIVSKDSNITNFYIGSTTNWTKRKQNHKKCCNNENDKNYNLQIYQIIRQNGDFENFDMILIEDYPCENKREAEKREQYWKELLKPDMNMINPFTNKFNKKENTVEYYKEYYQNELLKNKNYNKAKYQKNIERHKEYFKEYNKKRYTCEYCNKELSLKHKSTHEITLKHINNINLAKST